MGHHHHHHATDAEAQGNRRRLSMALALTATYMVAEVVGGLAANSLALLADAGHMFSDAAALGLSLVAVTLAQRPATTQRTYGFHRAEILAALANGAALLALSVLIAREACERLAQPPEVRGALMLAVAAGGLAINLANLMILSGGRRSNLNVRGAWLHVMADTLGSIGAMSAGVVIYFFGWRWADPVASFIIASLVLYSAWGLVRETLDVLMEGVPKGISVEDITSALRELPGVLDTHDLHVWSLTSGRNVATVHLIIAPEADHQGVIDVANRTLATQFAIEHATIQVEHDALASQCNPCGPAPSSG
ncbi:MAG: cation diffusion facilitator family transporter [Deltaproteobacteria bacterium]|nr:cation diffusion facilitator family transporter [Deltaproteobacteria bacterium]MBT8480029.1 cation diffusion facilitator family transporter [Deltaproteobacteria bacterium]NND27721.1 cation transporter [Myxococcales bacterium]NNL22896.1 cation transporter [Myxococcales bacterium]